MFHNSQDFLWWRDSVEWPQWGQIKIGIKEYNIFFIFQFFFSLKCGRFTMLWQSLLYSKVTQLYTYRHSFFNILFHCGLSQDIEYSSLCYTVGPCCLSILYIIVYIC